jgi:SHS2 domain-containing protein
MRHFKFLSHPADVRLKIEGDTLDELFTAGMEGMFDFIKKGFCPTAKEFSISENIKFSSLDVTALLIDFLSTLLTFSQEKKVIFCRVKFLKLTDTEIEAEVSGVKVDSFDEDLKAVTYHEAEIKKNPKTGFYETLIIFDI